MELCFRTNEAEYDHIKCNVGNMEIYDEFETHLPTILGCQSS